MSGKKLPVLVLVALVAGCATVRRGGGSLDDLPLDRAELARCAHAEPLDRFNAATVSALVGTYRLSMYDEAGEGSSLGFLELRAPTPSAQFDTDPLAGPPPVLVGVTDIDAGRVGAVVPGDVSSLEPHAPGVGVYGLGEDEVRIRLGSEANRRDRTRFDGAHTTLTLLSVGADRFGGSWRSDDGAHSIRGDFCAKRVAP